MRGLEQWLRIAPALAYRIVHDPLGEPLVVAAKVLGVPQDALQRILLFLNPMIGRSVERVYELASLFDEIDIASALALVASGAMPNRSLDEPVEEMPSGPILGFDNPQIRIEAEFARQPRLDISLSRGLASQTMHEGAVHRTAIVERGLRCRPIQVGGAVQAIELDEDCAGLVGAVPAYRCEHAFHLASPDIGGDPDR